MNDNLENKNDFSTETIDESIDLLNSNSSENKQETDMVNNIDMQSSLNNSENDNDIDINNKDNLLGDKTEIIQMMNNENHIDSKTNVMIDDEELLKAYVGKNYDKISTKRFSFSGLFFNVLYILYRKMYLEGILLFLLMSIANIFCLKLDVFSFNISVILNLILIPIICACTVNKYYLNKAKRRINKIKLSNLSSSSIDLVSKCAKKGGTSFSCLIVIFLLEIVLYLFVTLISVFSLSFFGFFSFLNWVSNESHDENVINNVENREDDDSGFYYLYDPNVNIVDILSYNISTKFEKTNDDSYDGKNPKIYEIERSEATGNFNSCKFTIGAVKNYSDPKKFLKEGSNKPENESIEVKNINNKDWYFVDLKGNLENDSFIYNKVYYATNYKEDVLYLEYMIEKEANKDECEKLLSELEKSLKLK